MNNKQPITYLNHLRNELISLAKRPVLIIFVIVLTLHGSTLDQLLAITFWLQLVVGTIIIFAIGQYIVYKYMQKTRCPFKERLSQAIRDDNTSFPEKTTMYQASNGIKKIRLRQGYAATQVIAALIIRDSKILIAQRGKKDALYGKWEFPGGKMEDGETEQETLARELNEELGIHAQIGAYFCSSFFEHRGTEWEMRAYFVRSFTEKIELREHQEVRWVDIKDLPEYDMPEPDKPIVQRLLTDS